MGREARSPTENKRNRNTMYEDRIIDIDTRCEAPETDISYEGAHLSAEYDADYDCTEISGQTYQCKDALKGLDGARWTGSAWIVDGNKVAHVRNADAHWAGGRTTLVRRIASALRTPMRDECAWCGDIHDCRVAEVTEAAICAALVLDGEAEAEPAARRIAISLRPVAMAAAAHAAHAVRSARARKAWETRRRNAARQAETLTATCQPLVVDADTLPASVAYSATPSAELCYGRTAHGTDGRVVTDYIGGPIGEWSDVRHDYLHMAHTDGQYCDIGVLGRALRPRYPHCYWLDRATCLTPAEGRRERRNARRRELYRQRRAA